MNVRVKICGVTRPGDAALAARLGADAIGLNFYGPSPRSISDEQALDILSAAPETITPVAVLVRPEAGRIGQLRSLLHLSLVQLHDVNPGEYAGALIGTPFVLAAGVSTPNDVIALKRTLELWRQAGAPPQMLLVDARVPGLHGGTGQQAPWNLLADLDLGLPLVLAGGLTPDNVAEAIRIVRPFAVDVASGVESTAGIKDEQQVRRFIENAREAGEKLT